MAFVRRKKMGGKHYYQHTTLGRLPLMALGAGLLVAAVLLALSKPA